MRLLKDNFQRMIRDDSQDDDNVKKAITGAARIYAKAASIKAGLYLRGVIRPTRLSRPVISIGNLTVGGTGKTPAAIAVAKLLKDMGRNPAILSRGYGGTLQKRGGLVSDGNLVRLSPGEAGDEPCLMALALPSVPVAVGRNRAANGAFCINKLGSDVILLDDGFQHLTLYRDINIVLADAERPFGNGRTLPRGPLREPACEIERADALVLSRALPYSPAPEIWPSGRPCFRACHRPTGFLEHEFLNAPGPVSETRPMLPLSFLKGKRVAAFSGIADNAGFFDTVAELGGKIVLRRGFDDHHPYTADELKGLFADARKLGADLVVTTEKDAVRIAEIPGGFPPLLALCVEFSFYGEALFAEWLKKSLETLEDR